MRPAATRLLTVAIACFASSACVAPVLKTVSARLYDLETAQVFRAEFAFDGSTRGYVRVALPSGEELTGEYVTLPTGSVGWGSIFSTVWTPSGATIAVGRGSTASTNLQYRGTAVATGQAGTSLECEYVTNTSRLDPQGYGACRDNHGTTYKLMFGE